MTHLLSTDFYHCDTQRRAMISLPDHFVCQKCLDTIAFDGEPVFVFGSNLAGIHGAGAAKQAHEDFGAVWGRGAGSAGRSYAIPTKDRSIKTLPLPAIWLHVREFLDYAKAHPAKTFFVTRIGCGLAGYSETEIAPFFAAAPDNCVLPEGWRK